MNEIVGSHDIVLITLDTLRYDVAQQQLNKGHLPNIAKHIDSWELRHSPGSFTYSAHQAIFAGFFPTPSDNPHAERLMALEFPGSETISENTVVFNAANIVAGLQSCGYHSLCVGGVGFFNKQTPLGRVIPDWFHESYWSKELGVTEPCSTENQIQLALQRISLLDESQRMFLFINVSAIHQPNCYYLENHTEDNLASHAAALRYVDAQLEPLFKTLSGRADTLYLLCSDHGTLYGESGFTGHRLAHEHVWNVPYGEFVISKRQEKEL